jgi:hypothetical protein
LISSGKRHLREAMRREVNCHASQLSELEEIVDQSNPVSGKRVWGPVGVVLTEAARPPDPNGPFDVETFDANECETNCTENNVEADQDTVI